MRSHIFKKLCWQLRGEWIRRGQGWNWGGQMATFAEIQLRVGNGENQVVAPELNGDESVCRWKQQGVMMDWMWPGERESGQSPGSWPELLHG